jgi:hypothetical protein
LLDEGPLQGNQAMLLRGKLLMLKTTIGAACT